MNYEWDPRKAAANYRTHSVRFADAVPVFMDERALTREDLHADEDRYVTLGMDALARVIVVVWTWRRDVVRIISARRATAGEREWYSRSEWP